MSFQDSYREMMAKPIEEIQEDIFFRQDNFKEEPWYGDLQTFMAVGICDPPEEYIIQVRKALKIMGYTTHTYCPYGKIYIMPGEAPADTQ